MQAARIEDAEGGWQRASFGGFEALVLSALVYCEVVMSTLKIQQLIEGGFTLYARVDGVVYVAARGLVRSRYSYVLASPDVDFVRVFSRPCDLLSFMDTLHPLSSWSARSRSGESMPLALAYKRLA